MLNTSLDAYKSIKPAIPSICEQVLTVLKAAGPTGMIMEEITKALPEVNFDSITPRSADLIRKGTAKIMTDENGVIVTRVNSRGRKQRVWLAA